MHKDKWIAEFERETGKRVICIDFLQNVVKAVCLLIEGYPEPQTDRYIKMLILTNTLYSRAHLKAAIAAVGRKVEA